MLNERSTDEETTFGARWSAAQWTPDHVLYAKYLSQTIFLTRSGVLS